jgi:hypothetical protein
MPNWNGARLRDWMAISFAGEVGMNLPADSQFVTFRCFFPGKTIFSRKDLNSGSAQ